MVGKPSILQRAVNAVWNVTHSSQADDNIRAVDDLDPFAYAGQTGFSPWQSSIYDGGKFAGGFGPPRS